MRMRGRGMKYAPAVGKVREVVRNAWEVCCFEAERYYTGSTVGKR